MTDWHVGMKVVCVEECDKNNFYADDVLPSVGSVYTVRTIYWPATTDVPVFRLAEINNPPKDYGQFDQASECGFLSSRFRPVVSRPTSIAVFTAMLDPTRAKETV